jgi:hypothetical protein
MMKLVPYDIKKLGDVNKYKKTKNLDLLEKFVASDLECAKVEGWTGTDAGHKAASLRQSIKRFKLGNIMVVNRKGNVYLIKTNT